MADDNRKERERRADWAHAALRVYVQRKGHEGEDDLTEIKSLIVDLLHEADLHQGMGFARDFLVSALEHFEAEADENA